MEDLLSIGSGTRKLVDLDLKERLGFWMLLLRGAKRPKMGAAASAPHLLVQPSRQHGMSYLCSGLLHLLKP
jgi:hypothetical protein